MILGFSTKLNGKPTYFVERIHKAFSLKEIYMIAGLDPSIHYPKEYNYIAKDKKPAKLHTIREDKNDRRQPGTKIDFFINCRQKNMFRFAPVLPVVSTQKIEIIYDKVFGKSIYPEVIIDEVRLHPMKLDEVAQNDGFDNLQDFFTYFNQDFKGKIIHWTNVKY